MAFDLSSPVAKLAFEMALKNQQAIESGGQFDAQARAAVSQALAAGNDTLAPYENIYRQYVDPAEAQRRAQAEAFNAYLIGLPELLAQAAKEGRSSGGGGGAGAVMDTTNLSNYESPADRLARIMGGLIGRTATTTTAPKLYSTPEERKKITRSGMGSRTVTAKAL